MINNPYGRVALVTGASSGIGKATAELLAENGFHVYGGSRKGGARKDVGEGFIQMVKIDVTDDCSVREAVRSVESAEGCIDILVNCAGNGVAGAVEECSDADVMLQMDTNYFGVIRVIRAVLPGMRERRRGLIINLSSVGGVYSIPFQSLYSSSKFAVEALTMSLRIELAPFGVKAAMVLPGDIKTGFTANRVLAEGAKDSAYGREFRASIAQMEHDEQSGKGPETIARVILALIKRKNPPVRKVGGFSYKALVFLRRLMPARAVEAIMTLMYPKSSL